MDIKKIALIGSAILFSFIILVVSMMFWGDGNRVEGHFRYVHKIIVLSLKNKNDCSSKGGFFQEEGCMFEVADEVKISNDDDGWEVEVSTVSENMGYCKFEQRVSAIEGDVLISRVDAQVQEGSRGDKIQFNCEVGVEFLSKDIVQVWNNGNCTEFCRKSAQIDIWRAQRFK